MSITPFGYPASTPTPGTTATAAPFGTIAEAAPDRMVWANSSQLWVTCKAADGRAELQSTQRLYQGDSAWLAWSWTFPGDFTPPTGFATMGQIHYAEPPAATGSPLCQLVARQGQGLLWVVRHDPANPNGKEFPMASEYLGQTLYMVANVIAGDSVGYAYSVNSTPKNSLIYRPVLPLPAGGWLFGPMVGIYRDKNATVPQTSALLGGIGWAATREEATRLAGWTQPDRFAAVGAYVDKFRKGSPNIAGAFDELLKALS